MCMHVRLFCSLVMHARESGILNITACHTESPSCSAPGYPRLHMLSPLSSNLPSISCLTLSAFHAQMFLVPNHPRSSRPGPGLVSLHMKCNTLLISSFNPVIFCLETELSLQTDHTASKNQILQQTHAPYLFQAIMYSTCKIYQT
jgi:hypothetical protein